jgi:hypothetical protein
LQWGKRCHAQKQLGVPSELEFQDQLSDQTVAMGNQLADPPAEPWTKADIFFLQDALRRGMSIEAIAGFLRRTADDVQAMAHELGDREQRRI